MLPHVLSATCNLTLCHETVKIAKNFLSNSFLGRTTTEKLKLTDMVKELESLGDALCYPGRRKNITEASPLFHYVDGHFSFLTRKSFSFI